MTRLFQPPVNIQVYAIQGIPNKVIWGRHHFQVDEVITHWRQRIWWRGIWREYYKLVLYKGRIKVLIVIFKNLLDGTWYAQEIYD